MRSEKRKGQEKAVLKELQALEENRVCRLNKRPPSRNALHSKRVYSKKTDVYCFLERLKARLVASGNGTGLRGQLPAHLCGLHGYVGREGDSSACTNLSVLSKPGDIP